jgi:hypothetical protein
VVRNPTWSFRVQKVLRLKIISVEVFDSYGGRINNQVSVLAHSELCCPGYHQKRTGWLSLVRLSLSPILQPLRLKPLIHIQNYVCLIQFLNTWIQRSFNLIEKVRSLQTRWRKQLLDHTITLWRNSSQCGCGIYTRFTKLTVNRLVFLGEQSGAFENE